VTARGFAFSALLCWGWMGLEFEVERRAMPVPLRCAPSNGRTHYVNPTRKQSVFSIVSTVFEQSRHPGPGGGAMTPSRKQAQSEGTTGPWFYSKGVKPGEWYTETKARTRAAMLNTDWPEKQRVWACLSLHTMGFGRELAVRMERGQTVPLRQIDIAKETGIGIKSVHRCVVELEREGWLLRETVATGPGQTELQIHCYALPRKSKVEAANPSTAPARPVYDGLPEELAYWLRHMKLGIPAGDKLEEARALAAELSDRALRFRACCKPEPKQAELPGILANPVKVAKSKPDLRAVESSAARGLPEPEPISRAAPFVLGARRSSNRKIRTDMKKAASVGRSVAKPEPQQTDRPTENTVNAVKTVIQDSGLCQKLQDVPSRALLEQVAVLLAGNPPEYLKNRIHVRFDSITGFGMLKGLAADVAAAGSITTRPAAGPCCWVCSKPFKPEDGSIDGAHFECYQNRK
jgi:hypothetical protein